MTTVEKSRLGSGTRRPRPPRARRSTRCTLERIRHVGWAYDNSPLHRRIYDAAGVRPADIRTWDDYHHKLPFTDKPHYVADQEASADGFGGIARGPET